MQGPRPSTESPGRTGGLEARRSTHPWLEHRSRGLGLANCLAAWAPECSPGRGGRAGPRDPRRQGQLGLAECVLFCASSELGNLALQTALEKFTSLTPF